MTNKQARATLQSLADWIERGTPRPRKADIDMAIGLALQALEGGRSWPAYVSAEKFKQDFEFTCIERLSGSERCETQCEKCETQGFTMKPCPGAFKGLLWLADQEYKPPPAVIDTLNIHSAYIDPPLDTYCYRESRGWGRCPGEQCEMCAAL